LRIKKIDKYYSVDLLLSSVVQQHLKNMTLRQLPEKNVSLNSPVGPFIAQGFHEWTTQFPSMDRENIGL